MDQIGDYLVRRLIGEGGMGKVYEAEERLSKRRVALKVLHQELARSEEGRRLFLNEMTILAHLEHPNIVRSLASTEVSGELVMVLEYLDGRTLRALLNAEGRVPWGEAVRIVAAVAAGLAAAHGQEPPIIHRDLKPENIMVLEGGAVKVMDFGIAKVIAGAQPDQHPERGHAPVHEPGADRRPHHRSPQRSVLPGPDLLRAAGRPPSLPVRVAAPALEPPVHGRAAAAAGRGPRRPPARRGAAPLPAPGEGAGGSALPRPGRHRSPRSRSRPQPARSAAAALAAPLPASPRSRLLPRSRPRAPGPRRGRRTGRRRELRRRPPPRLLRLRIRRPCSARTPSRSSIG